MLYIIGNHTYRCTTEILNRKPETEVSNEVNILIIDGVCPEIAWFVGKKIRELRVDASIDYHIVGDACEEEYWYDNAILLPKNDLNDVLYGV